MVYPSGGMGEDTGRDTGSPTRDTQRVTIAEAAKILGVKEPAIRKRIQRGTLEHDKGEDGRTYVYLDAGLDAGIPEPQTDQRDRIEELKDQIGYLRDQLAEEREARRRADTIIAQLTQANATLAARIPELEAPTEPRESPESAGEPSDTTEPRSATEGQQEPTLRRSWWRRMFGG
jgi:predicted ArsR family transcriptional regulator